MIEFAGTTFTYDGASPVLDGVDLTVSRGEFVCILGGNGSGKSTLAKHVNALLVPDEGRVTVDGHDTSDPDCTYLVRSAAGMVFQNPDDQLVASLIENDVAFGPENLGIPSPSIRERVTEALRAVGLQGFEKKETSALSGGQKQRVAIAGVLAMDPNILILDEASSMLDPRGRKGLMRVCRELHDQGMTIVMITHFMDEAALADRIVVLSEGRVRMEGTPSEVLSRPEELEGLNLEAPFTCQLAFALRKAGMDVPVEIDESRLAAAIAAVIEDAHRTAPFTAHPAQTAKKPAVSSKEAIRFEHVSFAYDSPADSKRKRSKRAKETAPDWGCGPDAFWAVHDVDFCVREGEFFGIAGHTGSGKSTLIQHMNGLLSPTSGRVVVDGEDISEKKAAIRARGKVGVVFQYPEHQLFAETVYDDVAFGPRNMGLREEEVDERVRQSLARVGLDFEKIGKRSPFELSGGQQRRAAFAGVLAMEPRTLVLDEPVAGLDPAAREDFLKLIGRLHAEGLTIVMVSHNMDDLARLCDRVMVLKEGEVFMTGSPEEVFLRGEELESVGLGLPAAQSMAARLMEAGVDLDPTRLYDLSSLASALLERKGRW